MGAGLPRRAPGSGGGTPDEVPAGAPEPALAGTGVGSAMLGCTTPGAPLGIVFLPAAVGGSTTGFTGALVGACTGTQQR